MEIAIVTGTIAQLAAVFVGDFLFHVSMPVLQLLIGALLSLAVALLYHFFVFTVDYTRTEYVQYEDDDYVYYVKAASKVAVRVQVIKYSASTTPCAADMTGEQKTTRSAGRQAAYSSAAADCRRVVGRTR